LPVDPIILATTKSGSV